MERRKKKGYLGTVSGLICPCSAVVNPKVRMHTGPRRESSFLSACAHGVRLRMDALLKRYFLVVGPSYPIKTLLRCVRSSSRTRAAR